VGGMLQRIRGGVVGTEIGVKIAQNPDTNGVAHGFDCTRGAAAG
jgi:hypothetical protein